MRSFRSMRAAALVALSLVALSLVALSLVATAARAQEEHGESVLELPHRARAIAPAGLVQLESMYVGHPTIRAPFEMHHVLSRLEARVPIEHLLLTASVIEGWLLVRDELGTTLVHVTGSPQLGAAYRDAIGSWRYELGGATTIPIGGPDWGRRWDEPPSMVEPLFPSLPLHYDLLAGRGWGGWYAGQLDGWSIQARARVEVDAIPEIVLAAEVVGELVGLSRPVFRTAIEGAYRLDALSLIGLRAQLVADVGWKEELVLVEPFLRVGRLEPVAGLVVHVAVPVVLWPRAAPFRMSALWSAGVRASAGAVF